MSLDNAKRQIRATFEEIFQARKGSHNRWAHRQMSHGTGEVCFVPDGLALDPDVAQRCCGPVPVSPVMPGDTFTPPKIDGRTETERDNSAADRRERKAAERAAFNAQFPFVVTR